MSVSIATAIIFIASLISFASVIGTLDEIQGSVLEAQRTSSERIEETMRTSIAITSVDRQNGTIMVVNGGEVTLAANETDVFINGTLSNDRIVSMSIDGRSNTNLWMPGEVLIIGVDGNLNESAIKILTANGVSAYD
jgi:archaellum component FlaF (FlaF/FlaG flagellin family)